MPCHNEEGNVARYERELFPVLASLGRPCEVVLVDDGSTDGTGPAAEALALRRNDTLVLRHWPNRGLGSTLRAGFAVAHGDWIVCLDADLTFRPERIKDLLDAAEKNGADLVSGSPYLRTEDAKDVPWARRLPSLILNGLYRGIFGLKLSAYTPMFRLYRTEKLSSLTLTSSGFEISAEIAARALKARWTVAEVPVPLETRVAGVSKLRRWRELARHAKLIARLLSGK